MNEIIDISKLKGTGDSVPQWVKHQLSLINEEKICSLGKETGMLLDVMDYKITSKRAVRLMLYILEVVSLDIGNTEQVRKLRRQLLKFYEEAAEGGDVTLVTIDELLFKQEVGI